MTNTQAACYSRVADAQRAGRLPRVQDSNCERCGSAAAYAHHEDYARPLDITFLCASCHLARHRELGWGLAGRPKSNDAITDSIRVRLGKELKGRVVKLADQLTRKQPAGARKITPSDVVRMALENMARGDKEAA